MDRVNSNFDAVFSTSYLGVTFFVKHERIQKLKTNFLLLFFHTTAHPHSSVPILVSHSVCKDAGGLSFVQTQEVTAGTSG